MPKLPWKSVNAVDPQAECTVMGSRLPLRQFRTVPSFLLLTMRIRKQLAATEGLLGYALDAALTKKTFWTVSAWTDAGHLDGFARTDPHHAGTEAIHPKMLPSTFVFWTAKAGELPIDWSEVRRRVEEAASGR